MKLIPISLPHLMIDIETMGTGANAVICAIGAVEFEINTGETRAAFYRSIDIQSCLDSGLQVDGATIKWWLRQNEDARLSICRGEVPLREALAELSDFIAPMAERLKLWSNGKHFDLSLLDNAYRACGMEVPWRYYNVRDVRTLTDVKPEIVDGINRAGTLHHALDDCQHQIRYCTAIWQYMNKNLVPC